MPDTSSDPFAAHLVGLWDFLDGSETEDTGLADGIAQNGHTRGDASISGGRLHLRARRDDDDCDDDAASGGVFDVAGERVAAGNDAPFDLATGTIAVQFTQGDHIGSQTNTLVNRGEYHDRANEGFFEIRVTEDGKVQVMHCSGGTDVVLGTASDFFETGDTIKASYSWSATDGGSLKVENLTDGTAQVIETTKTGLTMAIGDKDDESWSFGAREADDGVYSNYFDGSIDYVAVYDRDIITPAPSDGIVSGSAAGDLIDTGYTGDPDGDRIDAGDAILAGEGPDDDIVDALDGDDTVLAGLGNDDIYAGRGDDSVDGGSGDDLIYGDRTLGGSEPAPARITIDGSIAGFSNAVIAYTIDPVSGAISNAVTLTANAKDNIGDTFEYLAAPGSVIGIAISNHQGTFYSSAYGTNLGLNPDGLLHTMGISQGPDGQVSIGFEDLSGLGDKDFNDVLLTIDLGASGTRFDNAHYEYASEGGGGDDAGGNDTLEGGLGRDTIEGGAGDDLIDGGRNKDTLRGGDGDDTLLGGNGADLIFGDDGNDFLDGGTGTDTLDGGAGDDTILGATGDDVIEGGAGNDLIDGGNGGSDTMSGGADRDTFVNVDAGEVVDGGSGGDDYDILDLTGSVTGDGSLKVTFTGPDANGNGQDGFVTYFDSDGVEVGQLNFTEIEEVVPCFTPGTLIATPRGERPVESLQIGDTVITRDNGIQEIRWIGKRGLTGAELARNRHLRPVRIAQGALAHGLPERDMHVSPNHRILVANEKTALYFEESEVLVAAKHLTGLPGIDIVEARWVTYIHLMFDQHEVILSDGAWTESFQPGDHSLAGIGNSQRSEVFELFPELRTRKGIDAYIAARRSLKKREASLLTE